MLWVHSPATDDCSTNRLLEVRILSAQPCTRIGRIHGEKGEDSSWPTAEFPHRINQLFLEPLLFAHAAVQPLIRILNRAQFEEFAQDVGRVTAVARDLDNGERITITSRYLVGCDGGRSAVRHGIGA